MPDDPRSPARGRRKWLILAAKIGVFAILMAAAWATLSSAVRDLKQHEWTVDFRWVLASAAFYLAGILPSAIYWHRLLRAADQPLSLGRTVRAFYVSQAGKYVPGKAMVVVLRAVLLAGRGVEATVVATSVFVETLTTMAIASFLAAVCLAIWHPQHTLFIFGALGALAVTGLPTVPVIFKQIVRRLRIGKVDLRAADRLGHISRTGIAFGWVIISIGWMLQALSLWSLLAAISAPVTNPLWDLPLVLSTICLGVVAGFLVAFMPGGIGPRELILTELMDPTFGPGNALIAAILCRLVWLVSELVVGALLYLTGHERLRSLPKEITPEQEIPAA
jgi:uncharacterized membrane protein YbhN (UPF0104 family)